MKYRPFAFVPVWIALLLVKLQARTSCAQDVKSLVGITENNFYYKDKDSFIKALSFTTINGLPVNSKGAGNKGMMSSAAAAAAKKKPQMMMGMKKITDTNKKVTGGTAIPSEEEDREVAGGTAVPSKEEDKEFTGGTAVPSEEEDKLAFDGCNGVDFRFEIEHSKNVSNISADLYVSNTTGQREWLYNWKEGFLAKVVTSPYGETLCLDDDDRDYLFEVNGSG